MLYREPGYITKEPRLADDILLSVLGSINAELPFCELYPEWLQAVVDPGTVELLYCISCMPRVSVPYSAGTVRLVVLPFL